jgi:hypothetical protein
VSTRIKLWIAFGVVHAVVVALGWARGRAGAGDVDVLYRAWADELLSGGPVLGIAQDWVYPVLAWLPILLAKGLAGLIDYTLAWAVIVTAANAAAYAILIGRGRSTGRVRAAWFWLAALVALGGVGMFRLDGFTVPLALAAGLWLVRRPWLASVLLAVAVWIKVWPIALLGAAFIAMRRRLAIAGGALAVSAVIAAGVAAAGGAIHLLGFLQAQGARGLQMEAPVSTVHVWLAMLGTRGVGVRFDREIITMEVSGPGTGAIAALMTPLLAVAVLGIGAIGVVKAVRGARYVSLFPPLSLALVLALIVFNKVGSPQFMAWLIPPLAVAIVLDHRRWVWPGVLATTIMLLTQILFPWAFSALIELGTLPVVILALRNLLLVAFFAWTVARLARVPVRVGEVRSATRTE